MGPGHTMTMSGQGLLLLAVNWAFRPKADAHIFEQQTFSADAGTAVLRRAMVKRGGVDQRLFRDVSARSYSRECDHEPLGLPSISDPNSNWASPSLVVWEIPSRSIGLAANCGYGC